MEDKYKVIYSGEILDGYKLNDVEISFARLFKITPERASIYLSPNKVIKENISHERAQSYKRQLEKIGLIIELVHQAPEFTSMMMELESVVEGRDEDMGVVFGAKTPVGVRSDSSVYATSVSQLSVVGVEEEMDAPVKSHRVVCPKCQLEQQKAQQCVGCGVYIQKLLNQKTVTKEQESAFNPYQSVQASEDDENESQGVWLCAIAAIAMAVACAYIWMLIALKAEFEIAWVAMLIGGAIGMAASVFNKGHKNLIVMCCVLTVCSIVGGKLLFVNEVKELAIEEMRVGFESVPEEILRDAYLQMQAELPEFKLMMQDNEQTKSMLVGLALSQGYDEFVPLINDYLFSYLAKHVAPYMDEMDQNAPSFEQWRQELPGHVEGWVRDFSNFEILKVDFSGIDWLFLVLGVFAAFKVSRQQMAY